MSSLYEQARRALAALTDAPGFRADPVPAALLDEIIAVAPGPPPRRFTEPPWRFVVVVGDEREQLVSGIAEALARHWGLGSFGPRGLASDKVLSAPALVLVFSAVPSSEGLEAFSVVAGAAQNLVLLAHAAGLATHRLYSPHVVPEAVLDWVSERLGPEIRRGELVSMLAVGYPLERAPAPPLEPSTARWIGRADAPPPREIAEAGGAFELQKPAQVLRARHAERVLVADPYSYNRELIVFHLGAAGYAVKAFADGEELLAEAARGEPDLFVIAETLPDTTGFELVRRIRSGADFPVAPRAFPPADPDRAASGPAADEAPGSPDHFPAHRLGEPAAREERADTPIILTTARRDSAFRIAGLTAGVDYYLRKPIHPIELYTSARLLLDRHRLVDELRRATAFQETLLASMESVGVLALNLERVTVYASPGAARLTGYSRDDLVGRRPRFLAAGVIPERPRDTALTVSHDLQFRRKDGTVFDTELLRGPILDGSGRQTGYLSVFFDISARKSMEREQRERSEELLRLLGELRAAQAGLVQQAKMASLGQLVAGVAHEINTPLAAVVSNNDLFLRAFERLERRLRDGLLGGDDALRRDLDAVVSLSVVTRTACQRITGIVRTLRTFARLDESEVKAVDLHEGLESTLVLIAHLLKGGIAVERRYGRLPLVECHPNQLNQVFMNLLVNACQAIEASGPIGRIAIETRLLDGGDRVRVAIGDTGHGIPVAHLPRIFDPGFTTKGVGVGTGLGLSICYQIVEAHGGEIVARSEPGKGATFTITLPVLTKRS